jgi:hypothetical protein
MRYLPVPSELRTDGRCVGSAGREWDMHRLGGGRAIRGWPLSHHAKVAMVRNEGQTGTSSRLIHRARVPDRFDMGLNGASSDLNGPARDLNWFDRALIGGGSHLDGVDRTLIGDGSDLN